MTEKLEFTATDMATAAADGFRDGQRAALTEATNNANERPEYTQGICGDGAAILKDGTPMTIDEIVAELRDAPPAAAVVMPERMVVPGPIWLDARKPYGDPLNKAEIVGAGMFNLALDEVARLNPTPTPEPASPWSSVEARCASQAECDHDDCSITRLHWDGSVAQMTCNECGAIHEI